MQERTFAILSSKLVMRIELNNVDVPIEKNDNFITYNMLKLNYVYLIRQIYNIWQP